MKVADTLILFLPDHGEPAPEHWQWRWRQKLSTGRFVMPGALSDRSSRADEIANAVNASEKPVVVVGHGHGIFAAIAALPQFTHRVAGAFFVAPHDLDGESSSASPAGLPAHIRARLPFPAMLLASRNDPACAFAAAEKLSEDWGALLIDAGEAGHIDVESGYGPWPEGSMAFAQFLRKLE